MSSVIITSLLHLVLILRLVISAACISKIYDGTLIIVLLFLVVEYIRDALHVMELRHLAAGASLGRELLWMTIPDVVSTRVKDLLLISVVTSSPFITTTNHHCADKQEEDCYCLSPHLPFFY